VGIPVTMHKGERGFNTNLEDRRVGTPWVRFPSHALARVLGRE
jgi:hypothetical protein